MRFKLDFSTDRPELPIEYRRFILSFIKNALSKSVNGDLLGKYYADTNTKDFTWTLIVRKPHFTKERLKFEGSGFSVIFSTDDKAQTGMYLMLAFLNQKYKKYPTEEENFIVLKNIIQLNQYEIRDNAACFATMPGSSVIVREHNRETNKDTYYTCADEGYQEQFEKALQNQAGMAGFSEPDVRSIRVCSVEGRKIVVKHYGVYIDASIAEFVIAAPHYLLQHFYLNGVCGRKSMGFGMIEYKGGVADDGRVYRASGGE